MGDGIRGKVLSHQSSVISLNLADVLTTEDSLPAYHPVSRPEVNHSPHLERCHLVRPGHHPGRAV